jgi:hypothetical protein
VKVSTRVSIVVNVCGVAAAVVLAAACSSSASKAGPATSAPAAVTAGPPSKVARSAPTTVATARSSTPATKPAPPPPGLSGRIELRSSTLVAGSTERGVFVIVNNTDAPMALTTGGPVACKPGWAVILTNAQLPQEAAFTTSCVPRPLTVPVGETRLPFTLRSAYQTCSETGNAQGVLTPPCVKDANGLDVSPPLPPGDYRATFFSDISRFIPVASVPVHLVANAG